MQIARLSLFDVNKKRLLFRAFPFRFRQSGESLRNPSGFLQRPSPAVIELHRIQKKLPQRMVCMRQVRAFSETIVLSLLLSSCAVFRLPPEESTDNRPRIPGSGDIGGP
jgi:hypothetical protein